MKAFQAGLERERTGELELETVLRSPARARNLLRWP
jgi:hypothetical protein